MTIIIDCTISQTKPHSGVGQYVKNIVSEMVAIQKDGVEFILLLFEGNTTIPDHILGSTNVKIHRIAQTPFIGGLSSLLISNFITIITID